MKLLPLVLSVKSANWRMNDSAAEEADAEFATVRRKVRERDAFTCSFCGFRHNKPDKIGGRDMHFYMQVHHKNDNHHDNRPENLVTACMHCHAVQHIGLWGSAGEAVIVYLPEWPQYFLNHMCRVVLVAKRYHSKIEAEVRLATDRNPRAHIPPSQADRLRAARDMADAAQALFDRVRAREAEAQARLGTSDPAELGTAMLHLPDEVYDKRAEFLAPFRLLLLGHHHPGGKQESRADSVPDIVDGWLQPGGPFVGLDPAGWTKLLTAPR